MRSFFIEPSIVPRDTALRTLINAAAERLLHKLQSFDPDSQPISEYNREYLKRHMGNLPATLTHYAALLAWTVKKAECSLSDLSLLEHGGGTGLLCLLARELGVGRVCYNDLFETSARDAESIATAMGLRADHYFSGDETETLKEATESGVTFNAVVSNNVFEHVYDPSSSFQTWCSHPSLRVLIASTTANPFNPKVHFSLALEQWRREHFDRPEFRGHKENDSLRAYHTIRRRIIEEYAPELCVHETRILSCRTRGLCREDIISAVENYRDHRILPPALSHPTNTCDPLTGNWTEHLVYPPKMLKSLRQAGFRASLLPGFYICAGAGKIKSFICRILNRWISTRGPLGFTAAPFITYLAVRSAGD